MIIDKQNELSDKQALTATAVSTNTIDLGTVDSKAGSGKGGNKMIDILAQVTTAFAGGTSVQVSIQTSTDEAFTSPITLYSTAAIAVADLVAGYMFRLATMPIGRERYLRLNYTVVGTPTAGKVYAAAVLDKQTNGVI